MGEGVGDSFCLLCHRCHLAWVGEWVWPALHSFSSPRALLVQGEPAPAWAWWGLSSTISNPTRGESEVTRQPPGKGDTESYSTGPPALSSRAGAHLTPTAWLVPSHLASPVTLLSCAPSGTAPTQHYFAALGCPGHLWERELCKGRREVRLDSLLHSQLQARK